MVSLYCALDHVGSLISSVRSFIIKSRKMTNKHSFATYTKKDLKAAFVVHT